MDGWAKFHRGILNWEWYKDQNTFRVFFHLIMTANIKDTRYMGMLIPRGSLVLRVQSGKNDSLCSALDITEREARTAIKHLIDTGEITKKTTNKFTLINIVNYNVYQDLDNDKRQTNDNQATNKRQSNDKLTTSIEEEGKEEKEREEGKEYIKDIVPTDVDAPPDKSAKVFDVDSVEYKSSQYLAKKILERNPNAKVPKSDKELFKWCVHIERMLRIDERPVGDLKRVIDFATTDTFWSPNILSTAKLREKYDTLFMQINRAKQVSSSTSSQYRKGRFVNFEQPTNYNFDMLKELEMAKSIYELSLDEATTEVEREIATKEYKDECVEIEKAYKLSNQNEVLNL